MPERRDRFVVFLLLVVQQAQQQKAIPVGRPRGDRLSIRFLRFVQVPLIRIDARQFAVAAALFPTLVAQPAEHRTPNQNADLL